MKRKAILFTEKEVCSHAYSVYTFDKKVFVRIPDTYGLFLHPITGTTLSIDKIYHQIRVIKDSYNKVVARRRKEDRFLIKVV